MDINNIISIITLVWLAALTGFIAWIYFGFKNLLKDSKDKNFIKTFKNIQEVQEQNIKDILNLNLDLNNFKKVSKLNIQKVGLTKYNPFDETGGDHSFSLVLLDGNKNGIIITSLHTRERTRLYLKDVVEGSSKIELSKDESKALNLAIK
jgi:hypothetical protein